MHLQVVVPSQNAPDCVRPFDFLEIGYSDPLDTKPEFTGVQKSPQNIVELLLSLLAIAHTIQRFENPGQLLFGWFPAQGSNVERLNNRLGFVELFHHIEFAAGDDNGIEPVGIDGFADVRLDHGSQRAA